MEEQVIDALKRGRSDIAGTRASELFDHAIALAREAEAEALRSSNSTQAPVRVAYPPLVLLLAQAVDELAHD